MDLDDQSHLEDEEVHMFILVTLPWVMTMKMTVFKLAMIQQEVHLLVLVTHHQLDRENLL